MAKNDVVNTTTDFNLLDSIDENGASKSGQNIFKKPRLPLQENFNVSFQESNLETTNDAGLESSANLLKEKPDLFSENNVSPAINPFKSFQNEPSPTLQSLQRENFNETNKTVESDLSQTFVRKSNPFMRSNNENNNFSVDFEGSKHNLSDLTSNIKKTLLRKSKRNSDAFQVSFSEALTPESDTEKLTQQFNDQGHVTKKTNPFQKAVEESIRDPFEIDYDESTVPSALEDQSEVNSLFKNASQTEKNFNVSYNTTSSQKKLINNTDEKRESLNISKEIGQTQTQNELEDLMGDGENNKETEEIIREEMTGGLAITKSVANPNISGTSNQQSIKNDNSGSLMDQSSFNDDNLKYWMSDNSECEILPPSVPAVPTNISVNRCVEPKVKKTPSKQTTLPLSWMEKFNHIVATAGQKLEESQIKEVIAKKPKKKCSKPSENKKVKPQKLIKPGAFISARLYPYLIGKMEPKFGIQSKIEAERLILSISDTVKKVTRRKEYQKKLITNLKKELAKAGVVETTVDFYQFVRQYLPFEFRLKVIPSIQPVTNIIYPPKDTINPFDKIL